ncbi:MAG: hypothetical protein GXP50_13405, partial [Deltaproteobacteria bacterium]|nr:hypothetical protein [Deltaproteobacteria bacterium]
MNLRLDELWQPVAAVVGAETHVDRLPALRAGEAVVVRGHGGVLAVASAEALARTREQGRGGDPVLGVSEPARVVRVGQRLPLLGP